MQINDSDVIRYPEIWLTPLNNKIALLFMNLQVKWQHVNVIILKPHTTVGRGLPEIREASELKTTVLEGLTEKAGESKSLESSESWTITYTHVERLQEWLWKKNIAVI